MTKIRSFELFAIGLICPGHFFVHVDATIDSYAECNHLQAKCFEMEPK